MYLLFAYITGGFIILISLFNFAFKSRTISLILKAVLDFVTILNLVFTMLATNETKLFAGIIATCIGLTRDIVFIYRGKTKYLDHIAWPIAFSLIFVGSLIFTYQSPLSLLPAVGSVFSTMTLYARDQKFTKAGAIVCLSFYITYYAILLPTSGVLTIFSLVSSCAGLFGAAFGLYQLKKYERQHQSIK